MAIIPSGVQKGLNKASDVAGSVTQFTYDLLSALDPQWMCNFDVIFYPHKMSARAVASSVGDIAITKLHIQKIDVAFQSLEYEAINGVKHVKGIAYPDEISMTFIENDYAIVRNYIQSLINKIYIPSTPTFFGKSKGLDKQTGNFSGGKINEKVNSDGTNFYNIFRDDQSEAKVNAVIILKQRSGLPTAGGWVKLEGLKYKSMGNWSFDQGSAEPMMLDVTFSVDQVRIIAPISVFS